MPSRHIFHGGQRDREGTQFALTLSPKHVEGSLREAWKIPSSVPNFQSLSSVPCGQERSSMEIIPSEPPFDHIADAHLTILRVFTISAFFAHPYSHVFTSTIFLPRPFLLAFTRTPLRLMLVRSYALYLENWTYRNKRISPFFCLVSTIPLLCSLPCSRPPFRL